MSDELETILRLVAEGKLSPDEAEPIVAALSGHDDEQWPGQRSCDELRPRHRRRVLLQASRDRD